MTACVNRKHTKKVAAVVTASLVGALSLGVAPVAAMATEGIDLQAITADNWDGVDFTWNVEADDFGVRTVESGDQLMLTGAKDAFGSAVSMSDVTVLYIKDANNNGKADAGDTYWTTTPEDDGAYIAVVFNARGDIDGDHAHPGDTAGWVIDGSTLDYLKLTGVKQKPYDFKVIKKSLKGAFAYQDDNTSDTSFKFTGNLLDVNFADAEGKKLGSDVTVKVLDSNGNNVAALSQAGDYTAVLTATAASNYQGSETVKFSVDPIDFSKDVITVDPVQANTGAFSSGALQNGKLYVNGEPLAQNVLDSYAVVGVQPDGSTVDNTYGGVKPAKVTLKVLPSGDYPTTCYVGTEGSAEVLVVSQILTGRFFYDGDEIVGNPTITVETAKGETFDTSLLSAYANGEKAPFTWTAYKDGEAVTDFSEPGTYKVELDFVVPDDLSYAGGASFTVNVVSKHYSSEPKVFAAIDGKDVKSLTAGIEYDAEAVEPVIVAKDGSTVIDAADYTVTYTDADGEVVESMVEPGDYTVTVDFGNAKWWDMGTYQDVDEVTFSVKIIKTKIRSAKADKDLYAATGEAVTPTFTAYNTADLEGLSIEIDPAVTGVTYYKAKLDDNGTWWTDEDDKWVADEAAGAIKASDLKKAGKYVAVLTAPADDPHFQGETTSEMFEISEYAVFSDVDASEWYADSVYNAAKLGYMTGISGTDLFMPKADITRAELAKVFANMAGGADEGFKNPTQFDDVDPVAWYAEPIAWASEAGIVTGYDESTFGPMDKASREQVATMLYRYAKNQGKDVSVDDADAALAAYKDGDQVSDWAKTAMAWAVENGIFGVDTEELYPTENIQRCAVATIAVRFQPEALPEA